MYPQLFQLPVIILAALAGGIIGSSSSPNARGSKVALFAVIGAVVAALIAAFTPLRNVSIPVQGYGMMILIGFLTGVWMAARRSRLLGIDPKHCLDLSVTGVLVGLLGARILHVLMYWNMFDPFHAGSFDSSRIVDMLKIWEGGLVFFGTLLAILPYTYLYCKRAKIPPLPFLDLAIPSVFAGQAFGRVGCFLNGCCYGKASDLPWAVQFPPGSPPFEFHVSERLISANAVCSLQIHPAQIYAAISAALIAAFLYAYWPRRRYDGFILSLALIMAGSVRFFEELLRSDEPALFEFVPFMTIAHWIALGLILSGFGMMFFFRNRGTLYNHGSRNSEPDLRVAGAPQGSRS